LEQDEAVGGEDLADLEAGAVQRGGGSRSSAAGGASQAWRSSAGGWNFPGEEEQPRRVDLQAGRSRAGGFRRGGAEPAREEQVGEKAGGKAEGTCS